MSDVEADEIEVDKVVELAKVPLNYFDLCLRYDRSLISVANFILQAILALAVVGFCMGQLIAGVSSDERTIYFSLISGIVGYFMPNPKLRSPSKKYKKSRREKK